MFGFAAECFLRATLLVAGVWCALTVLRVANPRVRHLAWTAAAVAMLAIPFLTATHFGARLSVPLPTLFDEVAVSSQVAPSVSPVIPSSASSFHAAPPASSGPATPSVIAGIYVLFGLVLLGRLLLGTLRVRKLMRTAQPEQGLLFHENCGGPVTVGWWRPRVIVPPAFLEWTAERRRATLLHEAEHMRWRDPLAQWIALLNRSIFWIHPAAWWMERHLADLAEDACDRAVLDQGCSAVDYAGFLLDCAGSPAFPMVRFGMGIEGRGIARRIPRILAATASKPGWRTQARAGAALVLCAGVAFCSAALSVQPVRVPVLAPASTWAGLAPLPMTILDPAEVSLTAVANPADRPDSALSLSLRPQRFQKLTAFYLDLGGVNHEGRLIAVAEASGWFSRQALAEKGRAFAIIVRQAGRTEIVQDPTADVTLVANRLLALNSLDSSSSSDAMQGRIEAIESVVQSMLALPGERELVCLLSEAPAIPGIANDLSRPLANFPVRFVPSAK